MFRLRIYVLILLLATAGPLFALVPPPKPDEPQTPQHVESDPQDTTRPDDSDAEPQENPASKPSPDTPPENPPDGSGSPASSPDLPATTAPASSLPQAKQILEAAIEAIGGRKAFAEIESAKTVGHTASPAEDIGPVEILTDKHDRFLVRQYTSPSHVIEIGFDGEVGWIFNTIDPKYELLDDTQIKQLKEQAQIHRRVLYLADSFDKVETVARTSFNGEDCYKVQLTAKDAAEDDRQFAYFSVQTKMICGTEITKTSAMGPQTTIVMYTEWGEVANIKVAKEMKVLQGGQVLTTRFEKVEFNTVDPAAFALPAAVREIARERALDAATQPSLAPATQPASPTTDPAAPQD